ncbi:MAG TPA: isoprenylcysteine carboxylmethyltransferase family protein [Bacteroidota bacterium]|nr:isoprenylcysteine carboxylmethyltransferase family protein [Bacteroidota bacterium]
MATDVRRLMFRYRSYTPIPFLLAMVWFARPTVISMVVGFAVVFIGEMIRFWGVSIVGAETRTTGTVGGSFLITSGPFAYVRNPLYAGNMLLYAGVGIMSMALFPWMLLVAVAWFYFQYYMIVTREEEYLAVTFGEDFASYCSNVRRFVPRLTPYRSPHPAPKSVDPSEGLASERRTLQAIGLVTAVIVAKYVLLQFGG